jgi:hypothetical protein
MHRLCVVIIAVVVVVIIIIIINIIVFVIIAVEDWCLELFLMFESSKHALSIHLRVFVCSPVIGL